MENKKINKQFIWTSLRSSFWFMITMWILFTIFPNSNEAISLSDILWIISIFFTFVVSIIHLTKYKEKTLAIVALILSSFNIFGFLVGFLVGLLK